MQSQLMDNFTAKHLDHWLNTVVCAEDRDKVLADILAFMSEHPGEFPGTRPWSEIRHLAERTL